MRLLLIDNYDSFTYNLVQRIGELDASVNVNVVRNDKITVDQAETLGPSHLIISPGPCTPKESGVSTELIRHFRGRIPILGVCLGHQAIADVHGMIVKRHNVLMHGKTSEIHHDGRGLFEGLPNPFLATRYHSLIVEDIPDSLVVNATSETPGLDGTSVMGFRHETLPVHGVQFHPESIATEHGHDLLANFLRICGMPAKALA